MTDSIYVSVLAELVKSLQCYTFYFRLRIRETEAITTKVTPTPDSLYLEVNGEGIQIPTLAPIKSLAELHCEQIEDFLYIRVPCEVNPAPFRQPNPRQINYARLACKQCGLTYATGLEETLPLPSLHWEELSDLWSCHHTHAPTFDFTLRPAT